MSEKQRQSSKLLKSGSFDVCKNVAVPIIVILDHLEVSDAGMEPMEFNDCRGMSRKDRDTNGVLATI